MSKAREEDIPVRILDPLGPRWLRLVLPALSVGSFWLAYKGYYPAGVHASQLFCVGAGLLGLSRFVPPSFGWRKATLSVRPGGVEVKGAGVLSRTLRARSVKALSTANWGEGAMVTVAMGDGARPITMEVESGDQAGKVCDALGIGIHGLGSLRWKAGAIRANERLDLVSAAALMVLALCCAFTPIGAAAGAMILLWLFLLAAFAVQVVMLPATASASTVGLDAAGVDLQQVSGEWAHVPYSCIEDASIDDGALVLRLTAPHKPVRVPLVTGPLGLRSLGDDEQQQLVAQIRSACQRAKGLGPERPEVSAAVEQLSRGGTPARDWLARLDTLARSLASGGGTYRGEPLTADELWTTLDDHDAEPELRAAAARVLLRVRPEEARHRVAEVVSTIRDKADEKRLRVVVDEDLELEEAAERLDRIDGRA